MRSVLFIALLLFARAVFGAGETGLVKLGQITVNQREKLIAFPAKVNMTNGLLEYALVHSSGKIHESVLATEVQPHEIHAAMLLLGITATNALTDTVPSGQIDLPASIEPKGDRIEISAAWLAKNASVQKPLSALIYNSATKGPLEANPWVYNGSRIAQGKFLADLSGSVVSLITDLDALINNKSKGHDDDTIWQVNTNTVPAAQTPVQITIRLLPPKR